MNCFNDLQISTCSLKNIWYIWRFLIGYRQIPAFYFRFLMSRDFTVIQNVSRLWSTFWLYVGMFSCKQGNLSKYLYYKTPTLKANDLFIDIQLSKSFSFGEVIHFTTVFKTSNSYSWQFEPCLTRLWYYWMIWYYRRMVCPITLYMSISWNRCLTI